MQHDITQTGTTTLDSSEDKFSVQSKRIDGAQDNKETYWYFNEWPERLGYYSTIPEYNRAVDTYATWVLGRGFTTNAGTKVILDHIKGWGEDNFNAILWNMLVVKKVNGDAFAEIVRDDKTKTLLNIKPLDPLRMRVVIGPKGTILGYDYMQNTKDYYRYEPKDILHLCNNRIADQIHGTATSEAAKWVLSA